MSDDLVKQLGNMRCEGIEELEAKLADATWDARYAPDYESLSRVFALLGDVLSILKNMATQIEPEPSATDALAKLKGGKNDKDNV